MRKKRVFDSLFRMEDEALFSTILDEIKYILDDTLPRELGARLVVEAEQTERTSVMSLDLTDGRRFTITVSRVR